MTTQFTRKGRVIKGPPDDDDDEAVGVHESINAAKKASRQLQKRKGGLGCGCLKVLRK